MITVIIPTYNRGNTIKRAIDSVLNQTILDIELIIIDDNSDDDTQEVVKNYKDDRIRYFKLKENRGACYARNYGISIAKGQYIAFQDSDDEWKLDKLKKQLTFLKNNNLDIVSCKMNVYENNRVFLFPNCVKVDKERIYFKNYISTQTILGKKECFEQIKFDEKLPRFQDWDLSIRLMKRFKVAILDEVLVDVFIQNNSISRSNIKAINALNIFIEKYGENKKIKSNYLRLIALYKMEYNEEYKEYMKLAFKNDPFEKKNIFDFVLSSLGLKKLHYKFYLKKGDFKI